jgi:hypothetical protein
VILVDSSIPMYLVGAHIPISRMPRGFDGFPGIERLS